MNIDPSNYETLDIRVEQSAAYVTLNRPEVKNAMNFRMVQELHQVFTTLRAERSVRCIVLRGRGGTFCAGGDIKEMRENSVPDTSSEVNLDTMLRACNEASQIVIAIIEGAALGGGFGLACVSDIAIADHNAQFGLPEVRLGVAPAYISPYVLQRIGLTRSRELMLTGRRFNGTEALTLGLVHEVCSNEEIGGRLQAKLNEIRNCAPGAIAAIKHLMFSVLNTPLDETVAYRANLLNELRSGAEAQEGLLAFMQKRPPQWARPEEEQ